MPKLNIFSKQTPIAAIEQALSNLTARRQTLETRLGDATSKLEAARSARRSALESDPAADLQPLTRSVRDLEDEVATLNGVLDDLAAQYEQQMIALDRARDDDLRTASAKTLEGIATKVDRATEDLEAAALEVARAATKMLALLPPTLAVVKIDETLPEGQSESQRLISIIVADALCSQVPWLLPATIWGGGVGNGHTAELRRFFDLAGHVRTAVRDTDQIAATTSATSSAQALITDRLRDRAKGILAGDLAPELDDVDPVSLVRIPPKPVIAMVEVFATQNFAFRLTRREIHELVGRRWVRTIPEDAADAAVKAGVALRTDTDAGAEAFAAEKKRRSESMGMNLSTMLSLSDCVDLGVIRATEEWEDAA